MKIAIMTDMEGVAGILNFEDWVTPDGCYFEQGRKFLTQEVNAAADGFFAAGATEIVVIDGHYAGGIDPWLLDERVSLSRGWDINHQFGFNAGFDAMAWVGQHAKAGSLLAHVAHTGDFIVLENKINGISMGEFGKNAAVGGFYGVPAIFCSGDKALAEEAKALLPHIHTVAVKYGVNTKDGNDCDKKSYSRHTLGAIHMHPKRAAKLVREAAEQALRNFVANKNDYPPLRLDYPYTIETWFRAYENNPPYKTTRRHDSDIVACYNAIPEREQINI